MSATIFIADIPVYFLHKHPNKECEEQIADINMRHQNKEEIAEAVREAQKKIILFEDAKNNPEVIRQRMQDIDHGMANLLTLAAQSSQIELFEKKFKEMTEEKARLTEQLKQAEEDATTDAKRQKQLDDLSLIHI